MRELVSCIMVTTDNRSSLAKCAVECFHEQTYPNRELVIVTGPGTVGGKRNKAIRKASGNIIAHWDDDDWSAPERLEDQVARLESSGLDITGYHSMLFRDEIRDCWWEYQAKRPGFALGTSLVYRREAWKVRMFEEYQIGEDNHFIMRRKVEAVAAGRMMWARIHPDNTSPKSVSKTHNWRRVPAPDWT